LFTYAMKKKRCVTSNPVEQVEKPVKEEGRDRVLTREELRKLWKALDHERPLSAAVFKFCFYTVARRNEMLHAKWKHVEISDDPEKCVWMIPDSKSNRVHRVPLCPSAVKLLESLRVLTGNAAYIFDSPTKPGKPIASLTKLYERLRERTKMEDWQGLHDLRTAIVTHAGEGGYCPPHVADILLNHEASMSRASKVYNRATYFQDIRNTLIKWERDLKKIVGMPDP